MQDTTAINLRVLCQSRSVLTTASQSTISYAPHFFSQSDCLASSCNVANLFTFSSGDRTYDTSDTSNNQYQVWSDSKRNGDITKLLDDILCAAPCRGDCSKYELNSGRNCWSGHGGTDIDDDSIGVMDLSECLALCDDLDGCEGVVVENDNGGKGKVNCYRKKNIVMADCDWLWPFDTYTKK